MAIYVYVTATGQLYSYNPNDTDPIADAATLTAKGLTAVSGLPILDATHGWDAGTKTVVAIIPPRSVLSIQQFWQRFTVPERQAIENLIAVGTQGVKNQINAFLRYVNAGQVDCNDSYIQNSVQALETAGVIAVGRAAQILV